MSGGNTEVIGTNHPSCSKEKTADTSESNPRQEKYLHEDQGDGKSHEEDDYCDVEEHGTSGLQVLDVTKVVIYLERGSESRGFEVQPNGFLKSEEEVHVVNSLPAGSFEEVVDDRSDKQFATIFLRIKKAFVGIDHLFEVGGLVDDESERVIVIILLVYPSDFVFFDLGVKVNGSEYPAGEWTAKRDEVDRSGEAVLKLSEALINLL